MKGGHMRGKRLVGHRGLGRRLPPSVCIYNTLWVGRYESHRLSCRSERDDDILTAGLTEEPKCQCGTGRSITLVPTEINVWFVTYFNNCSTDWRDICHSLVSHTAGWVNAFNWLQGVHHSDNDKACTSKTVCLPLRECVEMQSQPLFSP